MCNISTRLKTLPNACSALKDLSYYPILYETIVCISIRVAFYCSLILCSYFRPWIESPSQGCHQLQAIGISYCKDISFIGFIGCPPTLAYMEVEYIYMQAWNKRYKGDCPLRWFLFLENKFLGFGFWLLLTVSHSQFDCITYTNFCLRGFN